ncbi:crossover junction endodeoxyribonuclease RuvC [Neoehrlichia mikurensis]|uniref:Crossover junction endodeoxyribonuclease RuvC n=1 Tax=Neoehrlichia mikurensis TaxID=89586 RepID=A0A9Q9F410_9RICK|nr:crossover junction endodeoxyribonuclease RuvC [Neoehrlichia mikurensis]QXK92322.1 crossover junction endodeoxyribonuclease RuvC [Neoehrlichia mikurensis]QXK92776.1 crossover junction endodeoxyribonuclease RuvC [Neoehrlichia mikurensis]QXK94017.1 crossover junction endodeoxyribonuclease RuvC [Neoehrlichia mikurensis]UTO55819.1 crossover junction endodeoxyribonuclease RuvC [Neoehrlichia mikurensis]UTO56734.1 crossover junction endodeoxyribonuclease RuvC [Neoehrlichia mikurensis]
MKKVIGIDPGLNNTGWGILSFNNIYDISLVESGVISTLKESNTSDKLHKIYVSLTKIIQSYNIDEASIEKIFININPKSSISLCYARGISLLSLRISGIPISEYSPTFIKKSITGNGHATKNQILFMINNTLKCKNFPKYDISDALAVAICHIYCFKYKKQQEINNSFPKNTNAKT